jgi:CheY-like chemotaxis protein
MHAAADLHDMPNPRAARVLAVDDDPDLAELYGAALSDAGYAVAVARGGDEALQLAEHWQPEVVVLDLMMPGLSGPDLVARLRSSAGSESVPVVALSAGTVGEPPEGVQAFLRKPFELDRLVETVDDLRAATVTSQ